jgi:hypothetical protein
MEWWRALFGDEDDRELLRKQRALDAQAAPRVPALQQAIWNIAAPISNLYGGSRGGGGTYPGNISQPHRGELAAEMARKDRAGILAGQREVGEGGMGFWMDLFGGDRYAGEVGGGVVDRRLPHPKDRPARLRRELPIAPGRAILPRVKELGMSALSLYPGDPITGPVVGAAGDWITRGRGQVMRSGGSFPERILSGALSTFVPPADTVTGGGHATLSQGEKGEQARLDAALAVQSGEAPAPETYDPSMSAGKKGAEGVRGDIRNVDRLYQAAAKGKLPKVVINPLEKTASAVRTKKGWATSLAALAFGTTPTQPREESGIAYGYAGRQDPRVVERGMATSKRAYGQRHSGQDPLAYQRLIAKNKAQGRDPYSGFSQEERVAYHQKPISRGVYPKSGRPGHVPPEIREARRRQDLGRQAASLSTSKFGQAFQPEQGSPWGIKQQPQKLLTDVQQRLRQIEELRRRQQLAQSGFSVNPTYY